MTTLYIAIDDTDNENSIGTGKLARMLADELVGGGYITGPSVTRHQLLVHPDIPFTSHNSCACIGGESSGVNAGLIAAFTIDFLIRNFHIGADPGLCIAEQEEISQELLFFGQRAQREVIQPEEARQLAEEGRLFTWWLGEPWRGTIGAMAGVALRSTGNDGRFIGLQGIREIKGKLTVYELLRDTAIDSVSSLSGERLPADTIIDSGDWIRPSLRNHQAVLFVEPGGQSVWLPIREKKTKQ